MSARGYTFSKHSGELIMCYNMLYTSKLIFARNSILSDKSRYYDPAVISCEGEMARMLIAEELPIEYSLPNQ
jgi:hypothetical protein